MPIDKDILPKDADPADQDDGDDNGQDPDNGADSGAEDDGSGEGEGDDGARNVGKNGFPENTPVAEMTVKEQAAYWKYRSRTNESKAKKLEGGMTPEEAQALRDELEALRAANLSTEEKARQEELEAARLAGEQAAREQYLPMVHNAQLQGYASTVFRDPAQLQAWMDTTNISAFVGEDGNVDGEKVVSTLKAILPEQEVKPDHKGAPKYHDFGQGRGGTPPVDKKAAGLAEAIRRGYVSSEK